MAVLDKLAALCYIRPVVTRKIIWARKIQPYQSENVIVVDG